MKTFKAKDVRKSWYACTGLTRDEFINQAIKKNEERKQAKQVIKKLGIKEELKKEQMKNAKIIDDQLRKLYRTAHDASHQESLNARIGKLKIIVDQNISWSIYSKSTRFPAKVFHNEIYLPYFYELPPLHLRVIDNLLNLKINHFCNTKENIHVYEAIWIEQAPGYNVKLINGWIAEKDNQFYHSKISYYDAVAGLQKKTKSVSVNNLKITDYINRSIFHKITGACFTGIDNFCNKAGIGSKRRIQIKELLPLLEVHAPFYYQKILKTIQ
jgi:hypothetical protein